MSRKQQIFSESFEKNVLCKNISLLIGVFDNIFTSTSKIPHGLHIVFIKQTFIELKKLTYLKQNQ